MMKVIAERFNAKWSEEKNRKIKKIRIAIVALLIAIIVLPIIITAIWSVSAHKDYAVSSGRWASEEWSLASTFNIDDIRKIEVEADGLQNFRIMVLADPQMKFFSWTSDTKTVDLIDKAIAVENPDLVVCTGDLALSLFNQKAIRRFCEYMNQKGIYWTFAFGNHDGEIGVSKSKVVELLLKYGGERLIFETGPQNLSDDDHNSKSNYFLNIVDKSTVSEGAYGEVKYTVAMLDSGDYFDYSAALNGDHKQWKYGYINGRQLDYYAWTMQGVNAHNAAIGGVEARALTYFHVPLPDFADMWYEYEANRLSTKISDWYTGGQLNEEKTSANRGVSSAYQYYDMQLEDAIPTGYSLRTDVNAPTVAYQCFLDNYCKAIVVGHDHINNFKGTWDADGDGKGIYLAYARGSGYHTYPFLKGKAFAKHSYVSFDYKRGNMFMDVNLVDGSFTVYEKTAVDYEL